MTEKKAENTGCRLVQQGYVPGSCAVNVDGKHLPACRATLKYEGNTVSRLITAIHLSRPENYLSIYQSGCNFSCKKCHSWHFSKIKNGTWYTPGDILQAAIAYEEKVSLVEQRIRATAWHAHETCRCCGSCVLYGVRSPSCPGLLRTESIVLSPQGFGPARNIIAFTGGDVTCCPEFYGECTELIKSQTKLRVLIETNGYGLTPSNLDYLKASGVDSFWLDIKAYNPEKHRWLTGCSNDDILRLPEEMLKRNFVIEVLSLYIPGLVETDEIEQIARLIAATDTTIPFTILAFFPEHLMKDFRRPSVEEMIRAYHAARNAGLLNIRLGNIGIFASTEADREYLAANVEKEVF